ncbi:unnamed protein product, partial [Mesorhabditis spiculigera]
MPYSFDNALIADGWAILKSNKQKSMTRQKPDQRYCVPRAVADRAVPASTFIDVVGFGCIDQCRRWVAFMGIKMVLHR